MTIPDFQTLMLPVLRVLSEGEANTSFLVELMEDLFQLSPEERSQLLPSGRQAVIANRTHWAIAYLNKTGLIERTKRAHYRITDRGKSVLAEEPTRIDLKYLSRFPELDEFRGESKNEIISSAGGQSVNAIQAPDALIRVAVAEIDALLKQQILDRVLKAKPEFFERMIARLALALGYGGRRIEAVRVVGRGGDGGIDVEIDEDALGLDRLFLQAKRYKPGNTVGDGTIRDFAGALRLRNGNKGVIVTTSSFSSSAKVSAERLGIVLIDGDQLAALMIRYDVGVRIEETFHIKKIDEDFFVE